ncbi:MAG: tRNA epoxyqueuosine(34) reductase QueG [Armatimonadetes bacterium]|nr:tRNA epoxyqueuosine(34) reductase QueG [Armatimonadota bacterium]
MERARELAQAVKRAAAELGFSACGITTAEPVAGREALEAWLAAGLHAGMAYMERDPAARCEPRALLAEARSVIVVGASCNAQPITTKATAGEALFARYAGNLDYHDVLKERLRSLRSVLEAAAGGPVRARVCVDSSPLLERALAVRAGLGFVGKSGMLIHRRFGTWLLLAELLVDVDLAPDAPAAGRCGRCTRCIDACPTGAILAPGVIDSTRCISYLTIEHRGGFASEQAARLGRRVFGCDVCQEVCPFNGRAEAIADPAFAPRPATTARTLAELAEMDEEQFREQFRRSPVKRAKWAGLRRNAAAALSCNSPVRDHQRAVVADGELVVADGAA